MSQLDPESIDHIAIYPSIGVARLGNSKLEDENGGWFYASEIPGKFDTPPGGYKDIHGDVKRQAARFRVYAFDSENNVLGELNNTSGYTIEWTVNLANKKGASYFFKSRYSLPSTELRNPNIQSNLKPDLRTDLIIDSGRKTISGVDLKKQIPLYGKFKAGLDKAVDVYLGAIFTDKEGRLAVLAGRGHSASIIKDDHNELHGDFNNDNWYDDTSDGIINVIVKNKTSGKQFKSEKASWILGVPPKYGSAMSPPVSLYDLIENVNYQQLYGEEDGHIAQVQYYRDIEPLLRRPVLLSWVNSAANEGHGVKGPGHFVSNTWQESLSDPSPKAEKYRRSVFSRLRFPEIKANEITRKGQASKYFMPRLSGDGGDSAPGNPETYSSLTHVQYMRMKRWADGDFKTDYRPPRYTRIEDFPIEDQPDNLTRAALEWCIGAPLYPGIEVSHNAEKPENFDDPRSLNGAFRFKPTSKPGDLTMTMSLPWQSDFYECNTHWWPSARPDFVVEEKEYERAKALYLPEHIAANLNRVDWVRGFREGNDNDDEYNGNTDMVRYWSKLGFIVPVSESNDPIFVETQRTPGIGVTTISHAPIKTIDDLRNHLKLAMRIELSTIPLYLFAMYSINDSPDFDTPGTSDTAAKPAREAKYILRSIASEEMLHLSLAGNLLLAIGGTPLLYDSSIIPTYPSVLPLRYPPLELHLRPATKENLQTFIDIELPEEKRAHPESGEYKTIGQFYDAIKEGFKYLSHNDPNLFVNARTGCQFNSMHGEYAPKVPDAGGLVVVHDLASALQAIDIIVAEGEGAYGVYDDPKHLERSHYTRFMNLKNSNLNWSVYNVPTDPKAAQYTDPKIVKLSMVFNLSYCYLLKAIEKLWTVEDPKERQNILYGAMYGTMTGVMGPIGDFLCQQQIPGTDFYAAPCFEYYDFDDTENPKDSKYPKVPTDPKTAMSNRMQEVIDLYNELGTNTRDTLKSIQIGIDNLYQLGDQ